jgi:tRNA pseudouridine32 synthase/23S rRNA pseudouridine746 synthase
MLHASALAIERGTKPPVVASAPLPADFAALGFRDG